MSSKQQLRDQITALENELKEEMTRNDDANKVSIGVLLRTKREEAKLTANDIAAELDVSTQTINKIETGKMWITVQNLFILCDLYKVTPNELLWAAPEEVEREPGYKDQRPVH